MSHPIYFSDLGRQILCAECGTRMGKQNGTRCLRQRTIATADDPAEPGEFERVLWGKANTPRAEERKMRINDRVVPLPVTHYLCDGCNAPIKPGEHCMAWSLWTDQMPTPAPWEGEYLS